MGAQFRNLINRLHTSTHGFKGVQFATADMVVEVKHGEWFDESADEAGFALFP